MEEEEEPNHSTSLSKYSPLYGVPGWVRGERAQQIARCFALNNATSYIWGQDTPQFRPLLNGISISQIACGSTHVAFLTSMGQVYTFGGNEVFQCGLGEDSAPFVEQPTLVTDLVQSQVSSIACGPAQTAAIVSETEFYLWGVDVCSQKRQGTPQEFLQWNKIGENKILQQIHLGPQHVSILVRLEEKEATEVWTWGASNRGLLGISADSHAKSNPTNLTPRGGQDKIKRQPVLVAGLHGEQVEQLAGSETHMVALTADGRVFAWGQNLDGFLGVERESFIVGAPVIVEGLDGVHVVQVSCGDNFTVCVSKDGETYSWGQNDKGQLGLGTTESTTIPTQITSLDDEEEICAVLCGSAHSCALTIERKSLLWGCGNDYCINPVSVDDALFPTELAACPVGISLGSNFTVAVFGTLEEIMDIPPYEKEEKKALPDLRALAGMSPEMKRRDRKRRQSGMSSRSIVISKDQTKNVKKQMSEEMVSEDSEDTLLLPPLGKLTTAPLPSPPSNIPPAISPSHLVPISPTTPLPPSPNFVRPTSPGLPLPLSQSFSTTPAPLCKTPSPSSQLPPPVFLPPPPSTQPSLGPRSVVTPSPPNTPPKKSLPRTHSKSLTMDNLLAHSQSPPPMASSQIPPSLQLSSSQSPPPTAPQANNKDASPPFASSAPDLKKEGNTSLSASIPRRGIPTTQGRAMRQGKPPPGLSSAATPGSPPLEKKGGLRIAMVQKERQKREKVQEPPRSSRGPVIPAKITQKQTGTIALPHLVMSNSAPLQVRFKIIRADGISAETPRCRLSLSRDAVRTQKSAVFQTPFADPPAFSWNHTLDLSVTKQEGDWYFTLESEGKAIPLALFCINVLELKNKANIPEEVTLQDIGDNNINLIVAVTTINWAPAVSESKQTTPKEKIPQGEPVNQLLSPEQKKKRRVARPLSDMRVGALGTSTRSLAERKRENQKKMSKRKSMLSMKGITGKREQSFDISGPSNYQHLGSGPDLMTCSTPIELHRPPSARGKEDGDKKKKKKKAKYAEVGELCPEGFYVIKILDSSGKDVGYIRALSSGRFAIGSDVGEDLTAVDQEYLFQHFHITMKRKGVEVDLSGLKNVKYEKFMSRPHVGQKLMATNILAAREMINTFDSKWTMFKDTKLKDPLPICLSDPTKGTDGALLAVSKTTTLSFTLISADEKPVELSSSFALLSPDQLKRGVASQ